MKFHPERFVHAEVRLRPIWPVDASALAEGIAAIPPWSLRGVPPARLASMLTCKEPSFTRLTIELADELAGVMVLQTPFLMGPYLRVLALFPAAQGRGIGSALLRWAEQDASAAGARWLWLCVSDINPGARRFYERAGYAATGELTDFSGDGEDETLMRKRLT